MDWNSPYDSGNPHSNPILVCRVLTQFAKDLLIFLVICPFVPCFDHQRLDWLDHDGSWGL